MPKSSTPPTAVERFRHAARALRPVHKHWAAGLPLLAITLAYSGVVPLAKLMPGRSSGESGVARAGARSPVGVEDLPLVTRAGFVRVDDLEPAPPVAVRPLRGEELTPEVLRRAD